MQTFAMPVGMNDLPYFHNGGWLIAEPTSLDKPTLRLGDVVTRAGNFVMQVGGPGLHEGLVSKSPFSLRIEPGPVCASLSTVSCSDRGQGLTVATAGKVVSFSILNRDEFANLRPGGARLFSTLLRGSPSAAGSSGACAASSAVAGSAEGEWVENDGATVMDQVGNDSLAQASEHGTHAPLLATRADSASAAWVRLASAGGLRGFFYKATSPQANVSAGSTVTDCVTAADVFSQRDPTLVEAPWQDVIDVNTSGAAGYAARWVGLVRPSVAGVYTFTMGRGNDLHSGERVRLWLENVLVIDQWTSLSNVSDGTSLPAAAVSLRADSFHDIRVAWKEDVDAAAATHTNSTLRMLWRRPPEACNRTQCSLESIPSTALFSAHHLKNSPLLLPVLPAALCAAQSCVYGDPLTLATAGQDATFRIISRDQFGNTRQVSADPSVHALDFALSSGNLSLAATSCNVSYVGNGQYDVSYNLTRGGSYAVQGRVLASGGLLGTYFENTDLTDHGLLPNGSSVSLVPSYTRLDEKIDFNWRKSQRPCGPPSSIHKDIGPDFFSVRWQGLIQAETTGVWTFYVTRPTGNDVKLLVNSLLVIKSSTKPADTSSSTSSSSSPPPSVAAGHTSDARVAGTVALLADTSYDITLEYRRYTAAGRIQLLWQAPRSPHVLLVPSVRLLTWSTIARTCTSSINNVLTVRAGAACAAQSSVSGSLMSVATAGTSASLIIISRDAFGNARAGPDRGAAGDPAFHVRFVPAAKTGHLSRKTMHTTLHRLPSHDPNLAGGLSATYYALNSFRQRGQPLQSVDCGVSVGCEHQVDFSVAAADSGAAVQRSYAAAQGGASFTLPSATGYTVRWSGALAAPRPGLYSFRAVHTGRDARDMVKLVVDGQTVLEGNGASEVSNGTIALKHTLPTTFRLTLDYTSAYAQNASGIQLLWRPPPDPALSSNASANSSSADYELVPSTQLFPLSGRHGVVLTPTLSGYYRTVVGLAYVGGLDATYYSDTDLMFPAATGTRLSPALNSSTVQDTQELPAWVRASLERDGLESRGPFVRRERSQEAGAQWLSPHQFSVRWLGLLRAAEHDDGGGHAAEAVFTFEAVTARASEDRVRLWVDDELLIDAWEGGSNAAAEPARGTIALRGGHFYQLRLEFSAGRNVGDSSAPAQGRLELRWRSAEGTSGLRQSCSSSVSEVIPRRCLYASRPLSSAFAGSLDGETDPAESMGINIMHVEPGSTCGAVSSITGTSSPWKAAAGDSTTFVLRARDAYAIPRTMTGDEWYAEAQPFPLWDALEPLGFSSSSADGRASQDCFGCVAVRAGVTDSGDDGYSVSVVASRAGAYKVLVDHLPTGSALTATYYSLVSDEVGQPAFSRVLQRMDSLEDFASHCNRNEPPGVLPNQVGLPAPTYQSCSGWLRGMVEGGTSTSVLLNTASWSNVSLRHFTSNVTDWFLVITEGSCRGQARNLSAASTITVVSTSKSLVNVSVSEPWSSLAGTSSSGHFGEDLAPASGVQGAQLTWSGCTAPDATSLYTLIPRTLAPGSLVSSSGAFATRWAGYVRTNSARTPGLVESAAQCLYTWNVELSNWPGNEERVKLWVDNHLLLDHWTSLTAASVTATVVLKQETMYKVQVLYKRGDAAAGGHAARMLLRWASSSPTDTSVACGGGSTTLGAVPLEQLSAGQRVRLDDDAGVLQMVAGDTSSGATIAMGSGLTEATAGSVAAFTIRARDVFGNLRTLHEDDWVVTLLPSGEEASVDELVRGHVHQDRKKAGHYRAAYTMRSVGDYSLAVRLVLPAGLTARHYNNAHLSGEVADELVAATVDLSQPTVDGTQAGSTGSQQPPDVSELVSVAWNGFFKAEVSETYTFWLSSRSSDAVRLSVGGHVLGSTWSPLNHRAFTARSSSAGPGANEAVVSGTLACEAGQLYELSIDYRYFEGRASARLEYGAFSVARSVVPSARLFRAAEHIFGSPFDVSVIGGATSAHLSSTSGVAFSMMTAGVTSTFVITARDAQGNARASWSDTWVVFSSASPASPSWLSAASFPSAAAMAPLVDPATDDPQCAGTHAQTNVAGIVSAASSKGRYSVQLELTRAGTTLVHIALAVPGSLSATYYEKNVADALGGLEVEGAGGEQVQEPAANRDSDLQVASVVTSGSFSVRYAGLVRPTLTTSYTFTAPNITAIDERVRLWVDGLLLIDQWASLSKPVGQAPYATFAFGRAHGLYELVLDYQSASSAPRASLTAAHSNRSAAPLPTSSLFQSHPQRNTPVAVTVHAARTDLGASEFVGDAVSCSTAGTVNAHSLFLSLARTYARTHARTHAVTRRAPVLAHTDAHRCPHLESFVETRLPTSAGLPCAETSCSFGCPRPHFPTRSRRGAARTCSTKAPLPRSTARAGSRCATC